MEGYCEKLMERTDSNWVQLLNSTSLAYLHQTTLVRGNGQAFTRPKGKEGSLWQKHFLSELSDSDEWRQRWKSLIHSDLNFVKNLRLLKVLFFFFFASGCLFVLAPLLKWLSSSTPSPTACFCTFAKN